MQVFCIITHIVKHNEETSILGEQYGLFHLVWIAHTHMGHHTSHCLHDSGLSSYLFPT
jgi:hypothetical protein